jgi:hypothetical protein
MVRFNQALHDLNLVRNPGKSQFWHWSRDAETGCDRQTREWLTSLHAWFAGDYGASTAREWMAPGLDPWVVAPVQPPPGGSVYVRSACGAARVLLTIP